MAFTFQSIQRAFRVRFSPSGPGNQFYGDNSNADLSCDENGNLWTRQAVLTDSASTGGGFTFQAVPGDDAAVIQPVPVILTQVGGFNDSAGIIYVQLFNSNLVPVTALSVPIMTFLVPAGATFAWNPSKGGRFFFPGISFGVSSTRDIYTALVTPIFLFAEGIIT